MSDLDEFVSALEKTLELMRNSHNGKAEWIQDVTSQVETQLDYYRNNGNFSVWGKIQLRKLFLPDWEMLDKPEIEEVADLNKWEDEYAEIAKVAAEYLKWYV